MTPGRIPGVVVRGHGVASGQGAGTPYPRGSVAMQKPFFAAAGLSLDGLFEGTLNVSIAPRRWRLVQALHRFERLRWTDLHPPETFSFAPLHLVWRGGRHEGWLYLPHAETKAAHFQDAAVLELLMPWIPGLAPGAEVMLEALPVHLVFE